LIEEVHEQFRKRKKEITIEDDEDEDAEHARVCMEVSLSQYSMACKEIAKKQEKSYYSMRYFYDREIQRKNKQIKLNEIELDRHQSYSSDFIETISCSICMQPIACAHNLVPCGHVFCYICIQRWIAKGTNKKCPQCNTELNQETPLVPNKTQDTIVGQFLQTFWDTRNIFGVYSTSETVPRAFIEYEERLQMGNNARATHVSDNHIFEHSHPAHCKFVIG
jgi:hypothetical protein